MATIDKRCDIGQGFNFDKDRQAPVGFITDMKVGETQFDSKITVKDPTAPTTDMPVVAVLRYFSWEEGGVSKDLAFSGFVDTKTMQKILLLIQSDMSKIEVLFKFKVYSFDPIKQQYFLCVHSNDVEMKGWIQKEGTSLCITVEDTENDQIASPKNFPFSVSITPQPSKQVIHIATSVDGKKPKDWGLKN